MRNSTLTRTFVVIILIVLSIGVWWFFYNRGASPKKQIRNIVLISMDTTRADALSCYGFKYKTTPNIDALAQEGILFEQVVSPAPMTLVAHSTMLTGTIPPYHGVHDNLNFHLDEPNVTLAEILKDNGFATGAIIGSFILDSQFGLDQGFDYYNDQFEEVYTPAGFNERLAAETSRIAGQWLEEHKKENMFLFLHFYDPHYPYDPPEPFDTIFMGDDPPEPNSLLHRQSLYSGEIAYVDMCIGRVIDKLKDLGIYDSTLIVLTGDHGEMFGQHGELTHTYFIYESAIKVPLVFKLPQQTEPKRVTNTVGLVDIVPTICSLLGVQAPAHLQGEDITAYLKTTGHHDLKRHVYCESLTATMYKANSLLAVVNDRFKYIQTTRPELYDIIEDPMESINLMATQPQRGRILQDRLRQILERSLSGSDIDNKIQLDDEALRRLESLGYIAGDVVEDFSFDLNKDDPKDLIEYHISSSEINRLMRLKKYDSARTLCRKLIAERPGVSRPFFYLATIAKEEGDYAEVIAYLRKVIAIEPENSKMHYYLGEALLYNNELEPAEEHLKMSLQIDPDRFVTHEKLADVFYLKKNFARSIFHLQKSLSLEPEQPDVLNRLATLYSRQGNHDQAIDCLTRSLQLNAEQPTVMSELAMAWYRQGKTQQAVTLWSDAIKLDPHHKDAVNALAWIHATSRNQEFYDPDQALTLARKACEFSDDNTPEQLDTLAAALAANGNFTEAVQTVTEAIGLAQSTDHKDLIADFQKHLELYKARQAYRE